VGFVPRFWLDEAAGMKVRQRIRPIHQPSSAFSGFRFPPEVILLAVRWYRRYGLSYRDLEELLAERGIEVDHVTLFRWVQRFTPLLVDAARPCRHSVGGHWFVDETCVKVGGSWRYVYRAVDQNGQIIDVFLSKKRDLKAAMTSFTTAIRSHGEPAEITTDRAHALVRVVVDLLPAALHDTTQYANMWVPRMSSGLLNWGFLLNSICTRGAMTEALGTSEV
jgi:transposase, IS6 family